MTTAILVDGAYFIKRFRQIESNNAYNAERAADLIHRWATATSSPRQNQQLMAATDLKAAQNHTAASFTESFFTIARR
ncbi:hypothetical protein [Pseudomonas anguilliseptica]|uniref:hypothetical protein n=1 Tax=Pseudomonas anguilliseptica TaxID=53406 RepID=UPI000A769D50|nr:hypothetical protein [Pseudomonas anguilliseptica]